MPLDPPVMSTDLPFSPRSIAQFSLKLGRFMRPPGTIFVVFNARSGRRERGNVREDIESALRSAGRSYEFVEVGKHPAQAAARAARAAAESAGIVVAAGGDGTMNTVAQAAFEADVAIRRGAAWHVQLLRS